MKTLRIALLPVLHLAVAAHVSLFSQTLRWESMDGPYRPENRTHLRFPDGDRRYYGTNSGTFRTIDGGRSWTKLSSPPASDLAIYQSPSGFLLARHTYWIFYPPPVNVNDFYSSSDGGEHWILSQKSHGGWRSMAFGGEDTVYQAFGEGTYKYMSSEYKDFSAYVVRSTDKGITWTDVFREYSEYPVGGALISELYAQPGNLFAHRVPIYPQVFSWSYVLRSTDGGTTWRKITADRLMFHPPDNLLRQRTDTLDIHTYSVNAYLELSTDDGVTWTQTLKADSGFSSLISDNVTTLLVLRKPGLEIFRSSDAGLTWANLGMGVPGDPFTSISFYGKTYLIGKTLGGTFYRSTDYGSSWMPILDLGGQPIAGTAEKASDSLFVMADWRGNWLESDDAGGTWRSVTRPFEGQKITSLLALQSGSVIVGSPESISRKRGGDPWASSTVPPGMPSAAASVWSLFYRSGPKFLVGTGGWKWDRYGETYTGAIYPLDTSFVFSTSDLLPQSGPMDHCRSVYSSTEGTIVAGRGSHLLRSTDQGRNFSLVGPSGPANSWSSIIEDSSHGLWAANDSIGLYRSLDTGLTWNASNAGLINLHALSMTVAPNGNLFVGTRGDGIFRSTDIGITWAASGLSGDTVRGLTTGSRSQLYAATSDGVRRSTNNGASWTDFSSGLSNKDIHALTVGPDGTMYCGTWGDGVYRLVEGVPDTASMALVEGGTFPMGSTSGDPDELPVHAVTVRSFYLDSKEVTVEEYRAFCVAVGRVMPAAPSWGWVDNHPIVNVIWDDANAYALWKHKRLPTEAEWEFAARGGTSGHGYLYSGSNTNAEVAWDSLNSGGTTHPVRGKMPNELGLYDMSGNASEWCSDWYDENYFSVSPQNNPQGPATGILRAKKGGSYLWGPYSSRITDRSGYFQWGGLSDVGFRCAADVITSVAPSSGQIPLVYSLEQNYPNPFNPRTVISSQLPVASNVRMVIYDVLGREVVELVNERRVAGFYRDAFDASGLASGIYICRMTAGTYVQSRKMLLVK